ncbi:glycine cleavage system aminomethyltransferase GcvT [Natrialbaceae archaeon A-chndr2]
MSLQTPPLGGVHDEYGAKFTDFGGWQMPVEFDSIQTEHHAVRDDVGKFDVSHMGEVVVSGPDATRLMQRLTSNDVTALDVGDSQYAAITATDGTILDDTVIYRLPDDGEMEYLFVPNAGNDEAMVERWETHREQWGLEATVENRTQEYAMVALQGPNARALAREAATDGRDRLADLSRFEATYVEINGVDCWTARTGYTGEDGLEFVVPWESAETVWSALECQPCGLGARDTLRLEAGYVLAGQDFDRESNPRTPYECGIGFTVKLDTEFVGRDALEAQKEEGVAEKLVGFRLVDRGIARHGYDITTADGDVIGTVTSGTMSPTLEQAIGLGYVPTQYADSGTVVRVDVRGRDKKAKIETLPFVETV